MLEKLLPSNPTLQWKRISPLIKSSYFFEREEKFSKRLRKGTSLLRIVQHHFLINSFQLFSIHQLYIFYIQQSIKESHFHYFVKFFASLRLFYVFIFQLLVYVYIRIVFTIHSASFTHVFPLTTTNYLCFLCRNQSNTKVYFGTPQLQEHYHKFGNSAGLFFLLLWLLLQDLLDLSLAKKLHYLIFSISHMDFVETNMHAHMFIGKPMQFTESTKNIVIFLPQVIGNPQ